MLINVKYYISYYEIIRKFVVLYSVECNIMYFKEVGLLR